MFRLLREHYPDQVSLEGLDTEELHRLGLDEVADHSETGTICGSHSGERKQCHHHPLRSMFCFLALALEPLVGRRRVLSTVSSIQEDLEEDSGVANGDDSSSKIAVSDHTDRVRPTVLASA